MIDQRILRGLELCVGAGGLALGNARAGFGDLAVIDIDGPTCETLRRNKKNEVAYVCDWVIAEGDISDVRFGDYPEIDLLSGGPPCQPFSQGGKRNGRSDKREMFPHFIRAIRESRPKTFIIENVKGLKQKYFLTYFNYIILQLRYPDVHRSKGEKWKEHRARLERLETGGAHCGTQYNVVSQVLQAADYGVAQRRERVFIVGVRADLELEYSFPLPSHTREALLADQWVTGLYWERHGIPAPECPASVKRALPKLKQENEAFAWRTVRDAISDLPEIGPGCASGTVLNHFLNPGARSYKGHDGCWMDAPAKTIKAGRHGVPGGENMLRLEDGSVRYFSVRECARLQAFPDEWGFEGPWCTCMRQIGNAVPVTLGEVVAVPLAKALLARAH